MKDQNFRLITKYALILSVFYIISFAFSRAVIEFEFKENFRDNVIYRQNAPFIFSIILNLITAFIVGQDIKKFNVKTKYVTLATIVYRPLGVFSFLLFLFFQDKDKVDNN
jgi:FtsH-binding integral membrane protein